MAEIDLSICAVACCSDIDHRKANLAIALSVSQGNADLPDGYAKGPSVSVSTRSGGMLETKS